MQKYEKKKKKQKKKKKKNIRDFYLIFFSVLGGEILYIFEYACFRNGTVSVLFVYCMFPLLNDVSHNHSIGCLRNHSNALLHLQ